MREARKYYDSLKAYILDLINVYVSVVVVVKKKI